MLTVVLHAGRALLAIWLEAGKALGPDTYAVTNSEKGPSARSLNKTSMPGKACFAMNLLYATLHLTPHLYGRAHDLMTYAARIVCWCPSRAKGVEV